MNEPRTVFLFERGILGWASLRGEWKNWPNQAVAWIHQQPGKCFRAQTLLYFVTALFAGLTRKRRARQFSQLIQAYKGWKIHIVAHSEGTATVLEALRQLSWPEIETLHLVCGACDSNFERNGLNFALRRNRVGKVFCYLAERDRAMKIEDTLLGLAMFGISWNDLPLGLSGPKNVSPGLWDSHVTECRWERYGHSDCWLPCFFRSTMLQIMANSRACVG